MGNLEDIASSATVAIRSSESTARREWWSVRALALAVFTVTTTEMAPVGLLPDLAADLSVSDGAAGISVTAFGLVAGLLAPVTTLVSGRADRRTLLLTILAVFTFGNAVTALAHTYWLFILSRVVTGAIHGLLWSIVAAVAIGLVRSHDGVRATTITFSGISLALVLGVPLGSALGDYSGWRSVFAALSVLSAIAAVILRIVMPRKASDEQIRTSDFAGLLPVRRLTAALVITLVVVVGNYAAYTYIAPFAIDARGLPDAMIGPILLAYGIAGVAGNFGAGYLLHRFGSPRNLLACLGLAVTLALAVLLAVDWRYAVVASMVVWGAAYSGIPIVLQTLVLDSAPGNHRVATSVYVLTFNLSIAAGALTGAVATDSFGPAAPILLGTVLCLSSVPVCLLLLRDTAPARD